MSLAHIHRGRRMAGAAALIGILFYTALIPLHTVSQASAALFDIGFGHALKLICHSGGTGVVARDGNAVPGPPAAPDTHCPFCQGLASFQVAIATALPLIMARAAVGAPDLELASVPAPSSSLHAPQNRGPPSATA